MNRFRRIFNPLKSEHPQFFRTLIKYKTKYLSLKGGGNEYTITVKQPWFDFIKCNEKTAEGRLNKGLFSKLKIGDEIIWLHQNLKYKVRISYINKYKSFKDMLQEETIQQVLPNMSNIDDGVKVYRQFYSQSDEEKFGVVAIGMKIINHNSDSLTEQTGSSLSDSESIIHESKLKDPHFDDIKNKKKIYEIRVYDEKRRKMHINDKWVFTHNDNNNKNPISTTITEIKIYKSFDEALDDTQLNDVLPHIMSKTEALKLYESFPDYKKDAEKYGVVRFKLKI